MSGFAERHGMSSTPEYAAWNAMRMKCYSENHPQYPEHLRLGISVCKRWRESFTNFYEDMGAKPFPKAWLVRKDLKGDYELDNCKWGEAKEVLDLRKSVRRELLDGKPVLLKEVAEREQVHLTTVRRWSQQADAAGREGEYPERMPRLKRIYHNGEQLTLNGWAQRYGIPHATLKQRLVLLKWPFEKAVAYHPPPTAAKTYEYLGRTQSLNDWAKELGLSYSFLYNRVVVRGWTFERAATQPIYQKLPYPPPKSL